MRRAIGILPTDAALANSFSFSSIDGLISPNSSRSPHSDQQQQQKQKEDEVSCRRRSSCLHFGDESGSNSSRKRRSCDGDGGSVAETECLVGCAAGCTALCCCLPLTLLALLSLVFFKLPASVLGRIRRTIARTRLKVKQHKKRLKRAPSSSACSSAIVDSDSDRWSALPQLTPCASCKGIAHRMVVAMPVRPSSGFGDQHFWSHFESCSSSSSSCSLTNPEEPDS